MQLSGTYYAGNGTSTPVTVRNQADVAAAMLLRIGILQAAQQEIYLKIGTSILAATCITFTKGCCHVV